jgi:hypothetical protein
LDGGATESNSVKEQNMNRHWKHWMQLGTLALAIAALPSIASAMPQQPPDHDTTRGEVASFDKFLDSHPKDARELRRHPGLIDNKEWLEHHPGVRDYLGDHPRVREEIKENPKAFMHREAKYEKHEGRERKPVDRDHDRDHDRR